MGLNRLSNGKEIAIDAAKELREYSGRRCYRPRIEEVFATGRCFSPSDLGSPRTMGKAAEQCHAELDGDDVVAVDDTFGCD